MTLDINTTEVARSVLASQPFSNHLGAQMLRHDADGTEIAIDLAEHHLQQNGFAHGGVVSYLADNALTFAGGTRLGPCLTLEYKINYVRPALGDRLIARATVLSAGRSQAVTRCDIFVIAKGEEKLCATAQGTIWKLEQSA